MQVGFQSSFAALNKLHAIHERRTTTLAHLASGNRITSAADDPTGLAVSERMRARIRSLVAAGHNVDDALGLVATADGALGEMADQLGRLREFATRAASGTLSTSDRAVIQTEVTQLLEEVARVANSTRYRGRTLFDGSEPLLAIQVGVDGGEVLEATLPTLRPRNLGIAAIDLTTASRARRSLDVIDAGIEQLSRERGRFGALQSRLGSTAMSLAIARDATSEAESRVRDTDLAYEAAQAASEELRLHAAAGVLTQANTSSELALMLLENTVSASTGGGDDPREDPAAGVLAKLRAEVADLMALAPNRAHAAAP